MLKKFAELSWRERIPTRNSHVKNRVEQFAQTLIPGINTGERPFQSPGQCYTEVCRGIKKRENMNDRVYLFADASMRTVVHAVLVNEDDKVLVDTLVGVGGKFNGENDYVVRQGDDETTYKYVFDFSISDLHDWFAELQQQ